MMLLGDLWASRFWLTGLLVVFVACHSVVNAEVPQPLKNDQLGKDAAGGAAGPPAVVKLPVVSTFQ